MITSQKNASQVLVIKCDKIKSNPAQLMEDQCGNWAEFENYWLVYAIFIFPLLHDRYQSDLLKEPANFKEQNILICFLSRTLKISWHLICFLSSSFLLSGNKGSSLVRTVNLASESWWCLYELSKLSKSFNPSELNFVMYLITSLLIVTRQELYKVDVYF